jgi:hypothetical protein
MEHLTVEDLLSIADEVIGTPAVRDIGLLDSAAHRPQASAFGKTRTRPSTRRRRRCWKRSSATMRSLMATSVLRGRQGWCSTT